MVSFTHNDAGTSEEDWARSGVATLPELPLDAEALAGTAFIVLAAHPDDESLGAGGLMARLHGLGAQVQVLLCTAGEASHPDSPSTTPEQLAGLRLREFAGALGRLVPDASWRYLGLPDGKLAGHRNQILAAIGEAAAATGRAGDRIVLVAPYRNDGHTDHDTLGSVAAEAAAASGHGLLEYPVWYWLWAGPEDPAWQSWLRLPLTPAEELAKAQAMAAHTSQVRALSEQPGDEVLLPPAFLQHFSRHWETFAWQRPAAPVDAPASVTPVTPHAANVAPSATSDGGAPPIRSRSHASPRQMRPLGRPSLSRSTQAGKGASPSSASPALLSSQ